MPKFVIEKTSGDGNHFEIEASSKVEALRKYLVHWSNIAELLAEHDSRSDPECVYLNRQTDERWSYLTLNIGLAEIKCGNLGCDFEVENDGDFCEDCWPLPPQCVVPSCTTKVEEKFDVCDDCTPEGGFADPDPSKFECEECGRVFDLSRQSAREFVCDDCYRPRRVRA
jgi:hypothetical protein